MPQAPRAFRRSLKSVRSTIRSALPFRESRLRDGLSYFSFLLLVVFGTLANATGGPPTRFVDPANDRDAAATLFPDDPFLARPRASARINLHPARTELNGGLGRSRRAAQQHQRD